MQQTKLNHAIQRRLACQRDNSTTNTFGSVSPNAARTVQKQLTKQDQCHIDVKY